mgnify:CR=1 FL=1
MAEYDTQYQQLSVYDDDDTGDDTDNHTEADLMIHMVPDSNKCVYYLYIVYSLIYVSIF